jgi:uncharacterized glyoxalase superfamily protein PhnB
VSLPTRELDRVYAALTAEGVEMAMPPTRVFSNTSVALIKDPDGNLIELIEHS